MLCSSVGYNGRADKGHALRSGVSSKRTFTWFPTGFKQYHLFSSEFHDLVFLIHSFHSNRCKTATYLHWRIHGFNPNNVIHCREKKKCLSIPNLNKENFSDTRKTILFIFLLINCGDPPFFRNLYRTSEHYIPSYLSLIL